MPIVPAATKLFPPPRWHRDNLDLLVGKVSTDVNSVTKSRIIHKSKSVNALDVKIC